MLDPIVLVPPAEMLNGSLRIAASIGPLCPELEYGLCLL